MLLETFYQKIATGKVAACSLIAKCILGLEEQTKGYLVFKTLKNAYKKIEIA